MKRDSRTLAAGVAPSYWRTRPAHVKGESLMGTVRQSDRMRVPQSGATELDALAIDMVPVADGFEGLSS